MTPRDGIKWIPTLQLQNKSGKDVEYVSEECHKNSRQGLSRLRNKVMEANTRVEDLFSLLPGGVTVPRGRVLGDPHPEQSGDHRRRFNPGASPSTINVLATRQSTKKPNPTTSILDSNASTPTHTTPPHLNRLLTPPMR